MTEEKLKLPWLPNTVVAYHGGGYDGCIWEWNYAFINNEGEFRDIYSTGVLGADTVEKLLEKYEAHRAELDRWSRQDPQYRSRRKPNDVQTYHVFEEEQRRELAQCEPISNVIGIAAWFQQQNLPYRFRTACEICDEDMDVLDGAGVGYHCEGGIKMQYNELICSDCESAGTCCYCGEFVGEEDMARDPENPDDHAESGYCKWCEHTQNGGPDPNA